MKARQLDMSSSLLDRPVLADSGVERYRATGRGSRKS
jgi:hypothetical protein